MQTVFQTASTVAAAFALAAACGLNPFIPLLLISTAANVSRIVLPENFTWLASPISMAILAALLAVHLIADKIVKWERPYKYIQAPMILVAGYIAFGCILPGSASLIGIAIVYAVFPFKLIARSMLPEQTRVVSFIVLSTVVDLLSATLALVALLCPLVAAPFLLVAFWIFFRIKDHIRRKKMCRFTKPIPVHARPLPDPSNSFPTAPSTPAPLETP